MKKTKREIKKSMPIMMITILKILLPFAAVIFLAVFLTVVVKWRWTKSLCSALFLVGAALLAKPLIEILWNWVKNARHKIRKTTGRFAER